ncbi:hypothetical protein Corgl_0253 [Coriobacterium glomerans PW2]|uniref:Uncharacterized protein n=1 Tax=Coriobacterium glomerans (strain ATCC 49209 / DSM 20642 / JCM 10262 / PW2) TaxID=700015 RepID=F2N740_CORGP|nr:hypothetical protein [Coriobacterium glomerans]AEB06379.1 hypothetical protein Corgl_0253 [Coriobacterium glomerans PW2]
MVNLLKADLFRMSRVARMHGYLWRWMIGLFIVMIMMNGIFSIGAQVMCDQAIAGNISDQQLRSAQTSLQIYEMTPSAFFAVFLTSPHRGSGLLVLLGCISATVMYITDTGCGYASAVSTSTRGRLAFAAERIVLAGVWTAALLIIMMSLSVLTMVPFGHMLHTGEPIGRFLLWALDAWLSCWALSVVSLAIACLTRSTVVSLGASVLIGAGVVARLVSGAAALLAMLVPEQPVWSSILGDIAALFPSTCLDLLHAGGASLSQAATGALAWLPGGVAAQALLVGGGWTILAAAVILAVSRRAPV